MGGDGGVGYGVGAPISGVISAVGVNVGGTTVEVDVGTGVSVGTAVEVADGTAVSVGVDVIVGAQAARVMAKSAMMIQVFMSLPLFLGKCHVSIFLLWGDCVFSPSGFQRLL